MIQKKFMKSNECFIRFENIGLNPLKSKSVNKGWVLASAAFLTLSIFLFIEKQRGSDVEPGAYVFYLVIFGFCALLSVITYKRAFYLTRNDNTNAIEFLVDNPSKEELESFIQILRSKRDTYMASIYGQIDVRISYERQHNQFTWLLENDFLTNQEYQNKITELKKAFTNSALLPGFSFGEN